MPRFRPAHFAFLSSFTRLFGRFFSHAEFEDHQHPCRRQSRAGRGTRGHNAFEKTFPGGYFHRTHSVIGQRMEHPMIARVSLPGYATHEIALTQGPMQWCHSSSRDGHRADRIGDRLFAGNPTDRHVDLQRAHFALSRLPWGQRCGRNSAMASRWCPRSAVYPSLSCVVERQALVNLGAGVSLPVWQNVRAAPQSPKSTVMPSWR
jgi:hypothetical protein